MTVRRWAVCCALVWASSGCFRTVYRNLEPSMEPAPPAATATGSATWRSFFLYGWLPPVVVVNAAAECGAASRVSEIRTRRSFAQGLVAMFATSAGMNVYSPWTGEVICAADRRRAGP